MAKAYWIAFYHSIKNPDALAAYAKLAVPAIQAAGGKFLARGPAAKAYGGSYPAPDGVHHFTLGVPDDPALHGKVVHYQTISIPSFAPRPARCAPAGITTAASGSGRARCMRPPGTAA